jgi:hypothetical protein
MMKRFITHIILYTSSIFLLFLLFEWMLGKSLEKGMRYYFQADWHDLKNHDADMLIIGNSRTWVHYDPFFIENKTGLKTEAIAQDGQGAQVVWLKYKEYLKHNQPPQKILLQFDYWFIHQRPELFGIKNFRTGFFKNRLDLRPLNTLKGYSLFYHFLPMAAIDLDLFWKWLTRFQIPEAESYSNTHGFIPQKKNWKGDWNRPERIEDTGNISLHLDSFFVSAKKNNIDLVLVYPPQSYPSYVAFTGKEKIKRHVDLLNKKYLTNVPWIDFNDAVLYNDSTLFYNHMHLNKKGVDVYMHQLLNVKRIFGDQVLTSSE